jgi:hypothetical protein
LILFVTSTFSLSPAEEGKDNGNKADEHNDQDEEIVSGAIVSQQHQPWEKSSKSEAAESIAHGGFLWSWPVRIHQD